MAHLQQLVRHAASQQACTFLTSSSAARGFSSSIFTRPVVDGGVPAFAFDIDGVLKRGSTVLPEAGEAMRMLFERGTQRQLLPFCVMTNGGGITEAAKAEELTNMLDVPISADQVILAHTPMRSLVQQYANTPVLVSGRHSSLAVARSYGFMRAVSVEQLSSALGGAATPFSVTPSLPGKPCPLRDSGWGSVADPFGAVLCMTDPDDWARDLQLCSDVILSHGVPGRPPFARASPVKVVFGQNDLLWVTEFSAPRFGLGAFATCLEALHMAAVGTGIHDKLTFGKPTAQPYILAHRMLTQQLQRMQGDDARLGAVYMVGDNPHSDIHGANDAGAPWVSVLVRTGVFEGKHGENSHDHPAHIVVDHVADAVRAALNRKRSQHWHSQR